MSDWPGSWVAGDRLARRADERDARDADDAPTAHSHTHGAAFDQRFTVTTIDDATRLQAAVLAGEGEWLSSGTWVEVKG